MEDGVRADYPGAYGSIESKMATVSAALEAEPKDQQKTASAIHDLSLGIGGAALLLIILGILMIKFSVKIPMRPFFLTVSILIYYLAFKFSGESIHALQVVNRMPSTPVSGAPEIGFLGAYPTLETTLAQGFLLLIILASVLWTRRKNVAAEKAAAEKSGGSFKEQPSS
ncbi:hypothetical protein C8P63_113101 [Melghirimyces profundicolus]|uniref:Uncharacterized protein n=1 Tax=Melghirimyces profundicolus TaxID=1242148 RepID=A0A2T6BSZ3_9BACL|nr:hypothetical protein [Melghirimyces profundicolus]PTX59156.1 hypothetical protein C8P63_113101 [Melghirimyces profundicolus]